MSIAAVLSLLDTAASTATSTTGSTSTMSTLTTLLPLVLIVIVFYFFLIRPQKKKEKETAEMRSNLQVGDEITTAGGIIGRVVSVREDTILIETGSDRSKVRIARWAVSQNNTAYEAAEKERAAAIEAKKQARLEKKSGN